MTSACKGRPRPVWDRGRIVAAMQAWARAHNGLAPRVVDAGGGRLPRPCQVDRLGLMGYRAHGYVPPPNPPSPPDPPPPPLRSATMLGLWLIILGAAVVVLVHTGLGALIIVGGVVVLFFSQSRT